MLNHRVRDAAPRLLTAALAIALALAIGMAVTLLLTPPSIGTRDVIRGSRHTDRVAEVRGPSVGRSSGDLTTVDGAWHHISCPPGKRPSGGGESSVICVAGVP
jgi:hypothetical protein